MRDYETQVAAVAKWKATPALVALGELREPPLPSPRPPMPYHTVASKPDGRTNQLSSGKPPNEIDFRRLTITTYATTSKSVADAMALIDETFSDQSKTNLAANPNGAVLTFATANWMRTEALPESHGAITRGEDVNRVATWKGALEYRIWTSRPKS